MNFERQILGVWLIFSIEGWFHFVEQASFEKEFVLIRSNIIPYCRTLQSEMNYAPQRWILPDSKTVEHRAWIMHEL